MNMPTNIPESVEHLKKYAEHYFSSLSWKHTLEVSGSCCEVGEQDVFSDLCLTIDGWLIITPYKAIEERPSIPDPVEFATIHYSLQKVVAYPGSRMEPDSTDIVEIKLDNPLRTPLQAIEKAIHILLDNEMEQIGTGLEEAFMTTEEEKFHKQYALEQELAKNNAGNEI